MDRGEFRKLSPKEILILWMIHMELNQETVAGNPSLRRGVGQSGS